jgi:hypothetical protein
LDYQMFDEADQPGLVDLVEKGLDVAIEHPVDAPPANPERECIQRLVLIALRSEPISATASQWDSASRKFLRAAVEMAASALRRHSAARSRYSK